MYHAWWPVGFSSGEKTVLTLTSRFATIQKGGALPPKVAEMFKNQVTKIASLVAAVSMLPVAAMAALAPADEALILTGINSADATFYKIGGGILIVLAGIWGFMKVKGLLGK